ncbi:MAG: LamG domain-containing protein [Nitrospira sp.]|nr:LamG domain-containing protein [Nitrospira sp.]
MSGSTFRSTASVITFDQWQHVAAAVDTVAGTAQIWVNGQAVSLTAVFGPATWWDPLQCEPTVSRPTARPEHGGWGGHFKGEIDEVRLYGRTLTLAEVQSRAQTNPWRPMSMTPLATGQPHAPERDPDDLQLQSRQSGHQHPASTHRDWQPNQQAIMSIIPSVIGPA